MAEITLIETNYMTLKYFKDTQIICHTVHKPVNDRELREALNAGTETLIKYKACKWLSDDHLYGAFLEQCGEWEFNDWSLRTIDNGWKFWALVVPQWMIDAGSMLLLVDDLSLLGLCMMVFTTTEDALAWLERQPE
jgi:hypothetical protein